VSQPKRRIARLDRECAAVAFLYVLATSYVYEKMQKIMEKKISHEDGPGIIRI
jgi:hypothetical protein